VGKDSQGRVEPDESVGRLSPGRSKITSIKTFLAFNGYNNFLFVKIETDDGIHGVGEGSCSGKSASVQMAVKEFERHLIGKDPGLIEYHYQALTMGAFWRSGIVSMSALSAIDQALWDIKGKRLGVPVYELLGGKVRDKVRCYTHIGGESPEELAADARRVTTLGWRALKTSSANYFKEAGVLRKEQIEGARKRLTAAREAVGEDVDLMVDNHGRFSAPEAIALGKSLEGVGLFFFEEPVPPEDIDGLVRVSSSLNTPVATGERLLTRNEVRPLLERNAAAIIQSDVCHAGGISELRRIAILAEAYGIKIAPHNPNGPISTAAAAHVAAVSPNFLILEVPRFEPGRLAYADWALGVVKNPLKPENGYVQLTDRPGLGIELDEDIIAQHPYNPEERAAPRLSFEDGSLANW